MCFVFEYSGFVGFFSSLVVLRRLFLQMSFILICPVLVCLIFVVFASHALVVQIPNSSPVLQCVVCWCMFFRCIFNAIVCLFC